MYTAPMHAYAPLEPSTAALRMRREYVKAQHDSDPLCLFVVGPKPMTWCFHLRVPSLCSEFVLYNSIMYYEPDD